MSFITRSYSEGTVLTEGELDDFKSSIEAKLNTTKLSSSNIQAASITSSVLQTSSITTSKIAASAITSDKLDASVSSQLCPTGLVISYAASAAPTSWLICDGTAVSRTTYASLFNSIGTAHGTGDGSTTFNLPDYRGRFLRGLTADTSRDPDLASRTVMNTGGASAGNIGSIQADEYKSHTHTLSLSGTIYTQTSTGTGTGSPGYNSLAATTSASGGNESRPKNVYLQYIIKT